MMHSSQAPELKAQGVEEAARDPDSNATSEDAQKVIAEESKKAGVPAFRFDPNATPAEKAAAANAALPAGFHREKAHGVGVVTDIGGGPDQYDLPSPTAKGVVESPPATNDARANGHIHHDEQETYEKKTGWAPRFGQGDLTEEEANASLLDHTTWLEGRMDEKFFGDWYHNSAIIMFACLASWVVAILGGGLGWIFLVMTACGTYYRTSIRRTRRNFRDDLHREMVKAKLEEDVESLEWINSFLVKFWPIYAPVIAQTIINSVDQVLSTSTPAFLDSIRLKFFTLGTKPPRLEHVKTYPRADDEEVVMDWKFSFTPNDITDLTARQLKNRINPKVVLEVRIGKGVVSKGLDIIVEDMAFSGLMRVKIKLQIQFPHIEKVDICFLGKPDIDYVCKPLGGDTLGFDINFIPGLESFIKEQIHANLSPIMYQPNVFPIEIAKMLAGSPVDQAIGVLAITIYGAQGLKNPDNFSGSPDPYIVASLNGRSPLGKTKTVPGTSTPRFNETIYVIATSLTDTLHLQVFDYNEFRKDKDLGTATFVLEQCQQVTDHENLQLEVIASGNKHRGLVQADVRFFPVLEGLKLDNGTTQPPPESNTGIARFTVEQAKDLDGSKSMVGKLNPYAILLLNGKEIHKTDPRKRTNQPIWTDNAKEFLVTDRKNARLGVVLKDERDIGTHPIVGTYQIKLDDLMTMTEQGKEWFNLAGVNTGRAKLMLTWKPVGLRDVFGAGEGYMTPIGVMRLHFQCARDLRNVETMGKSDPYVRVLLSGIQKGKTVTFQNNLNPDWDEVIYVPVHSARERLTLEVMDYQNVTKDRSLGLVELATADYVQQAQNGEYLVNDEKKLHKAPLRMLGKGTPKGVLNFTSAFYPVIPVLDPEQEEAEKKDLEEATKTGHSRTSSRNTVGRPRTSSKASVTTAGRNSLDKDAADKVNEKEKEAGKIDTSLAAQLEQAEIEQKEQQGEDEVEEIPRIKLTPDELTKYESGLLVFRLISAELSRPNLTLEVLMDDMAFPSYTSTKARSKKVDFGETGDAMVREIDLSRITVRLVEKVDKKGDGDDAGIAAKLSGDLLPVLQRCLYTESELSLGSGADTSKVKVLMKYLPIKMRLDPSESMNNMGSLRVDVLDAADLPSADRNGFSDPFCKFSLNGESVFKSKVQKKTLHPAWNEFFEVPVPSRTAAKFHVKVLDEDFGGKTDFLGEADINLEILEPMQAQEVTIVLEGEKGPGTAGAIRLRLLFKAAYVTRTRHGSSTFSGSIGPAGKVIGAPVKGVGKVGGAVGGGLVKGATFMRHGFKNHKDSKTPPEEGQPNGTLTPTASNDAPILSIEGPGPARAAPLPVNGDTSQPPSTPSSQPPSTPQHTRSPSMKSLGGGTPGKGGEAGTAEISILSASGYPAGTKVQVYIKQLPSSAVGSKGHAKDLLKTKPLKASSPETPVTWDGRDAETLKHPCAPDAQFQIQVRNHSTFGAGDDLGERLFFVDDSSEGGAGSERVLDVGQGKVTVRSRFVMADQGSLLSSGGPGVKRRSFLSKRDTSRGGTPS